MSEKCRIAILGGGVGAIEAAIGLHDSPNIDAAVTVIAPELDFHYRPLAALEPFGVHEHIALPLKELLGASGAELIHDHASSVDTDARKVITSAGPAIEYDALIVSTGAVPQPGLPGADLLIGPDVSEGIGKLLHDIGARTVKNVAYVVPHGNSWALPAYEFALLTAAHGMHRAGPMVKVFLVTAEERPLEAFGLPASALAKEVLKEGRVELVTRAHCSSVEDGVIKNTTGRDIEADRVVSLPTLEGHRIPGLPCDENGFLHVDEFCRVRGVDGLYAAGDVTDFPIKQGGIAAQQADTIVGALAVEFGVQEESDPFDPQLHAILFSAHGKTYLKAAQHYGAEAAAASTQPLWTDAEKIYSRHLSARIRQLRARQLRTTAP